jgi:hypothetical protein
MAACCQEVRQLEDKFDGLELNHIPRWLNEVADTLAKMVSDRELVLTSIFASDQYKPSVCYEELKQTSDEPSALGSRVDQPSIPFDPKVMELDEDPVAEPDPLADRRTPYLDCLPCGMLSADKMEAQQLAHHTKSFVIVRGELYKRSHIKIL